MTKQVEEFMKEIYEDEFTRKYKKKYCTIKNIYLENPLKSYAINTFKYISNKYF